MLQKAGHIKATVVSTIRNIQCLHLMNSKVAWILVSLGTQAQSQTILDPDYLPDYLSVFYDSVLNLDKNSIWDFHIGTATEISMKEVIDSSIGGTIRR